MLISSCFMLLVMIYFTTISWQKTSNSIFFIGWNYFITICLCKTLNSILMISYRFLCILFRTCNLLTLFHIQHSKHIVECGQCTTLVCYFFFHSLKETGCLRMYTNLHHQQEVATRMLAQCRLFIMQRKTYKDSASSK